MARSIPESDAFRRRLRRLSYDALLVWARQAGVPHPELYATSLAWSPAWSSGQAWTKEKAAKRLRTILLNEFNRYNLALGNLATDSDGVAAPNPSQPSLNQWWSYFGAASRVGNSLQLRLERPQTLAQLLDSLAPAAERDGPVHVRVVGGGHSISSVAEPPDGAVFLDLSRLGTIDPGPSLGDIEGAQETGVEGTSQAARGALARGFLEAWQDAGSSLRSDVVAAIEAGDDPAGHLVRIPVGLHLRHLNFILWAGGFSFFNLGSFAEQTFWGAATTGTHGSNLSIGPLSSSVVSIDAVIVQPGPDGRRLEVVRVEPDGGITDPAAFGADERRAGWRLIQDSSLFHALTVSMGSMGVVFAATVRVSERFTLREKNFNVAWQQVDWEHVMSLRPGPDSATTIGALRGRTGAAIAHPGDGEAAVYWKININPYHRGSRGGSGANRAVIVNFADRIEQPSADKPKPVNGLLKGHKDFGPSATYDLAPDSKSWRVWRDILGLALYSLVDDAEAFESRSYRVFAGGVGYFLTGCACEIALPLDRVPGAVDAVLELVDRNFDIPALRVSSPISLRFVKATNDWLSPQYRWIWGREVDVICMLEFLGTYNPQDPEEYFRLLNQVVAELCTTEHQGRPHWGMHLGNGDPDLSIGGTKLRAMYGDEAVDAWVRAKCAFDPLGVFNNAFTDLLDLPVCDPGSSQARDDDWLIPVIEVLLPAART